MLHWRATTQHWLRPLRCIADRADLSGQHWTLVCMCIGPSSYLLHTPIRSKDRASKMPFQGLLSNESVACEL